MVVQCLHTAEAVGSSPTSAILAAREKRLIRQAVNLEIPGSTPGAVVFRYLGGSIGI